MNGAHLRWGGLHSIPRIYEAGSVFVLTMRSGSARDRHATRRMDTAGAMVARRASSAARGVTTARAVTSATGITGPSRRTAVGTAAGRTTAGRTAGTAAA